MEMLEVEVWVKVNESGEYEVGRDEETACDRFAEQSMCETESVRLVKLVVKVPKPRPLAVKVELPDDQTGDEIAATVTAE